MPKYNHAYDIAFSLVSKHPTGDDETQDQRVRALLLRIENLIQHNEMLEAVGMPFDTYTEEE